MTNNMPQMPPHVAQEQHINMGPNPINSRKGTDTITPPPTPSNKIMPQVPPRIYQPAITQMPQQIQMATNTGQQQQQEFQLKEPHHHLLNQQVVHDGTKYVLIERNQIDLSPSVNKSLFSGANESNPVNIQQIVNNVSSTLPRPTVPTDQTRFPVQQNKNIVYVTVPEPLPSSEKPYVRMAVPPTIPQHRFAVPNETKSPQVIMTPPRQEFQHIYDNHKYMQTNSAPPSTLQQGTAQSVPWGSTAPPPYIPRHSSPATTSVSRAPTSQSPLVRLLGRPPTQSSIVPLLERPPMIPVQERPQFPEHLRQSQHIPSLRMDNPVNMMRHMTTQPQMAPVSIPPVSQTTIPNSANVQYIQENENVPVSKIYEKAENVHPKQVAYIQTIVPDDETRSSLPTANVKSTTTQPDHSITFAATKDTMIPSMVQAAIVSPTEGQPVPPHPTVLTQLSPVAGFPSPRLTTLPSPNLLPSPTKIYHAMVQAESQLPVSTPKGSIQHYFVSGNEIVPLTPDLFSNLSTSMQSSKISSGNNLPQIPPVHMSHESPDKRATKPTSLPVSTGVPALMVPTVVHSTVLSPSGTAPSQPNPVIYQHDGLAKDPLTAQVKSVQVNVSSVDVRSRSSPEAVPPLPPSPYQIIVESKPRNAPESDPKAGVKPQLSVPGGKPVAAMLQNRQELGRPTSTKPSIVVDMISEIQNPVSRETCSVTDHAKDSNLVVATCGLQASDNILQGSTLTQPSLITMSGVPPVNIVYTTMDPQAVNRSPSQEPPSLEKVPETTSHPVDPDPPNLEKVPATEPKDNKQEISSQEKPGKNIIEHLNNNIQKVEESQMTSNIEENIDADAVVRVTISSSGPKVIVEPNYGSSMPQEVVESSILDKSSELEENGKTA